MSLHRPLSILARAGLTVGSIILLVGISMLGMLYLQVEHEVDELQYDQLTESGHLLLRHLGAETQRQVPPEVPIAAPSTFAFSLYDNNGRLLAKSHDTALALPARPYTTHFFVQKMGSERWRCAVFSDQQRQVVVAQPESLRDELALEIGTDLMIPVSVAMALLLTLAVVGLWYSLQPLRRFAAEIRARAPSNLAPLSELIPQELAPVAMQLNLLFARIEETMAREQRFTGDAAHELRTPLAALQVQLEVARTSPRPEAREKALGKLQEGMERLGRLVTQLLALARLDAAGVAVDLIEVDIPALARQVVDEVQVDGEIVVQARTRWLAEPDMLALILRNVLENSKRYGGANVRVRILIKGPQLDISDNGPGVPTAWLGRLGERFVRPPGQTSSGSGLGLSMVIRAAERMGATATWGNDGEGGGFAVHLLLRTTE